jgi:hypothetical protein
LLGVFIVDREGLKNLGKELRGIGHRRRELAERVYNEATEGDTEESRELYKELSNVTAQAIDLMQRQRDILEKEVLSYQQGGSPL